LNAFFTEQPLAFAQIILAIGLVEGTSQPGEFWTGKGDREAGNYHYDPTGFWNKATQVGVHSSLYMRWRLLDHSFLSPH
jgi:hypothetical protein